MADCTWEMAVRLRTLTAQLRGSHTEPLFPAPALKRVLAPAPTLESFLAHRLCRFFICLFFQKNFTFRPLNNFF
jgi:hypothetical protein